MFVDFKYTPPKLRKMSDDDYGKVNELDKPENNNTLKIPQTESMKKGVTLPPLSLTLTVNTIPMTSVFEPRLNYKRNLKNILSACRIWKISLIRILSTYSLILATNTFKTLGTEKGISTRELTNTISLTYIVLIALGFCIGCLAENVSFRILFVVINIYGGLACYFIPYALDNNHQLVFKLLGACNIVLKLSSQVILVTHLFKVFTPSYFLEASTVTNVVAIIIEVAGSVFPVCIDRYYGDSHYALPFKVGLWCNALGLLVTLFEGEDQFDLKKLKKCKKKEKKKIDDELIINDLNMNDL